MALGIPPQFLIGAFPSVNGCFFNPTYGTLIAAINFDQSGTTRIGKYILNHSFMRRLASPFVQSSRALGRYADDTHSLSSPRRVLPL